MKSFSAPLCALTFVLAACSSEPAPAPAPEAEPSAAAETKRGDYTLTPLNEDEILAADLPDEATCTFKNEQGTMLIASAFADSSMRGYGIIKVNGFIENLQTPDTGGFLIMSQRGEFEGRGLAIDVETSGGALETGEIAKFSANMNVDRAAAEPRVLDGEWACGGQS